MPFLHAYWYTLCDQYRKENNAYVVHKSIPIIHDMYTIMRVHVRNRFNGGQLIYILYQHVFWGARILRCLPVTTVAASSIGRSMNL